MPDLLVIDDELEVTDYLKQFFERHGLEVSTASTAEEGLKLSASTHPRLVLLDVRLSQAGMTGMEVLRRAREGSAKPEIIMLTAVEDRNVIELAKGLGVADYITKPFVLGELERVVLSRLKGEPSREEGGV